MELRMFRHVSLLGPSAEHNSHPQFLYSGPNCRNAVVHQNMSGVHFIRKLPCFVFTIPTDQSLFFSFFPRASWLGMRALPSVARGLPDWLESFRREKSFWGLESECETLGDAACIQAKNTHSEQFAHSRKSTQSFSLAFPQNGSLQVCYCTGPGDTAPKLHRKNLETASFK